jgi:hypothetical protein
MHHALTSAKRASPFAPLIPFRTPVVSEAIELDLQSSAIFFRVSTSAEPIWGITTPIVGFPLKQSRTVLCLDKTVVWSDIGFTRDDI